MPNLGVGSNDHGIAVSKFFDVALELFLQSGQFPGAAVDRPASCYGALRRYLDDEGNNVTRLCRGGKSCGQFSGLGLGAGDSHKKQEKDEDDVHHGSDLKTDVTVFLRATGCHGQLKVRLFTPAAAAALSTSMMRSCRVRGSGRMMTGSLSPNFSILLLS